MIRERWSGDEWEGHCRALLSARYGHEIQFIPSRDGGDGGLEAYTLGGVGYQCYAPQEAFTVDSQTAAQKRKVTADVHRLRDDPVGTAALLGSIVLRRWVLLTPAFDSRELVEHARRKSRDIRELDPSAPWASDDFEIVIQTDDDFSVERAAVYGSVVTGVDLAIPSPSTEEVFASVVEGLAEQLTSKLRSDPSAAADPVLLEECRGQLLRAYVRGQQQMDLLRNDYSALAAAVQRRMDATLSTLALSVAGASTNGMPLVRQLVDEIRDGILAEAPPLTHVLCEDLAWYAVATWLIECPLRFRASA